MEEKKLIRINKLLEDLKKSLSKLGEALDLTPSEIHRDATIQRFEFSFELSWKVMQAVLRVNGIDCVSPRGCIRDATRLNLIEDPKLWFSFLETRNLVSHTYDEKQAQEVYEVSKKFLPHALSLANACEKSQAEL